MSLTRVATSMIALTALNPGGFGIDLESKLYETVSVKDFGAIGDGNLHSLSSRYTSLAAAQAVYPFATSLDDQIDWAAWQAAINYAHTHAKSVYGPAGNYQIDKTILIDNSSVTSQYYRRPDILGSGPGACVLTWRGGNGNCIHYKGPELNSGGAIHFYTSLTHIRFEKYGAGRAGIAIRLDNVAYWSAYQVVVADGFSDCVYGTDVLSAAFYSCVFRGGLRGMTFRSARTVTDTDYESGPNNINLFACTFGNLSEYAIWQIDGAGFNMYGGSVEGIGMDSDGGTGTRWGVKIDKAGREGAVGVNIDGTYFERNHGVADVWIDQPDPTPGSIDFGGTGVSYNFKGVNFHRIAGAGDPEAILRNDFTTNNIRIDTQNLPFSLGVYGCGFRGAGHYTPDASRQCIQIEPNGARGWSASVDPGNFFSHDVDRPTWTRQPTFLSYLSGDQSLPVDASTRLDFRRYDDLAKCFENSDNSFVAPFRIRMAFNLHVQVLGLAEAQLITLEMRVNGNLVANDTAHVNAAGFGTVARSFRLGLTCVLSKNDRVTWHIFQNGTGSPIAWSGLTGTWVEGFPV